MAAAEKIRAIVTGATGMVGEGVMHQCLLSNEVAEVLVINRKPCGVSHPKLKEIIHADFFDFKSIEEQLAGYSACYFCLGVSSVGMDADKYYRLTYTLTLNVADVLSRINPGMTFCYVSGAHTDSTEQGKVRWARVKGKTENDLMKLPFKAVYNFRPGIIIPTKGLKNTHPLYKYMGWLLSVIKFISPSSLCSLQQIGQAMINVTINGYNTSILEISDIRKLGGE